MRCECVKCVCCDGFDCDSLVAGVRKGRGRELGRETTRERGGRREEGGGRREEGNACKEAIVFAIPSTN